MEEAENWGFVRRPNAAKRWQHANVQGDLNEPRKQQQALQSETYMPKRLHGGRFAIAYNCGLFARTMFRSPEWATHGGLGSFRVRADQHSCVLRSDAGTKVCSDDGCRGRTVYPAHNDAIGELQWPRLSPV